MKWHFRNDARFHSGGKTMYISSNLMFFFSFELKRALDKPTWHFITNIAPSKFEAQHNRLSSNIHSFILCVCGSKLRAQNPRGEPAINVQKRHIVAYIVQLQRNKYPIPLDRRLRIKMAAWYKFYSKYQFHFYFTLEI